MSVEKKARPDPSRINVVGIGASAGGIEALREFFAALSPELGLAYVVIVHLAPDHESELASILSRRTRMPVVEVTDQQLKLAPNSVYVIPPDRKLELRDGSVRAVPFVNDAGRRSAIDLFFHSLAENYGDGFAVIMSGGGSDGALGAKAIKEAGGLVLVQDPREAAHAAMPRAVIDSGVADVVLPVRTLAQRLGELSLYREKLAPLIPPPMGEPTIDEDGELALKRIFELVRMRTGHDFSRYKRATILRRVGRRIQLNHQSSLASYLALLRENADEVQALFDDLLISVTSFFRDPQAWEALRVHVVVPLVERASANASSPIRVWVPACATGEEAYTLAMLFREEIARRDAHCELVIFGSDVDQGALASAREGLYPAAIASDIAEPRLVAFFSCRGRELPHHQRDPRLRGVCGAQRAARPTVLEAAPDFLPQPAHLPRPGASAAAAAGVPLRVA